MDVAYAVQENLEFSTEVTVWTQGIFDVSRTTLQALMRAVETFDFAVFIFAPDDVVKIRKDTFKATRDNVVFELGLFTGGLGEDRTFLVVPRGAEDLHLPTDLAGITPAMYEANRSDQNLVAALGPACTKIRRVMAESGPRAAPIADVNALATPVAAGLSEELRAEVRSMLRDQEASISDAFARFEGRVTAMLATQRDTAKAPIQRLLRTIRDELSPPAQTILRVLAAGGHLTLDQYRALTRTQYGSPLEELRKQNLLVPLSGVSETGERIPVYWFPPGRSRTIVATARDLTDTNPAATEALLRELVEVGYQAGRLDRSE